MLKSILSALLMENCLEFEHQHWLKVAGVVVIESDVGQRFGAFAPNLCP